jgi:hypothetical protein
MTYVIATFAAPAVFRCTGFFSARALGKAKKSPEQVEACKS